MTIANALTLDINQPHHNTSLLGVIEGASRYFELPWQSHEIFVYSGHAFVINVSEDLCPSSPYVWHVDPVFALFENLNLKIENLYKVIPSESNKADHEQFNEVLIGTLDSGKLVGIENMDHQLVVGYDDKGFTLAQPWMVDSESTPPRLDFDSWGSFANGVPVHIYSIEKINSPSGELKPTVQFALDIWDNPGKYQAEPIYGVSSDAYKNYIAAMETSHSAEHGCWWNGVVWSECKSMAAKFFDEKVGNASNPRLYRDVAMNYRIAASGLMTASFKDKNVVERQRALERSLLAEERAVELLREVEATL